jgi:hypothetical protein
MTECPDTPIDAVPLGVITDALRASLITDALRASLITDALRASGVAGLRATGGSMAPAIRSRDTLVIVACGIGGVRPHDVIVFGRDGRLFAHRLLEIVVRVGTPWLRTRGDALWQSDGLVAAADLLGRVVAVGRRGTFRPPEPCRPLRRARALVASECVAVRSLLAR